MDTYLSLRVHLVWATKDRRPWLDPEWRSRLFACAATIVTRKGGRLLCAGAVRDHMHLYVEISATTTIAKLVSAIKSNTARWIHHSFPHRRDFKWQHGYGAFTVSASMTRHSVSTSGARNTVIARSRWPMNTSHCWIVME